MDVLERLIEGPSHDQVDCAITRLRDLGALDLTGDLTALGYHLAALPVDVRYTSSGFPVLFVYNSIDGC